MEINEKQQRAPPLPEWLEVERLWYLPEDGGGQSLVGQEEADHLRRE